VGVFLVLPMFLLCFGFMILVIRRFRMLLFGETTNRPSGLQWCPILTPKWHAVDSFVMYELLGEAGEMRVGSPRMLAAAAGALVAVCRDGRLLSGRA